MIRGFFKLLFFLVFLVACIEASAYLLFPFFAGQAFSFAAARAERQSISESQPLKVEHAVAGKLHVVHPYQGFVNNPNKPTASDLAISNFGFMDDASPIVSADEDTFVIGIFGGSVAWWFGRQGREVLLKGLREIPELKDKKFRIVNAAIGAYKQPQQLSTLSFLTSQGAHFDLVFNIDGFNEVALSPNQIDAVNVYPFFPYNWHLLAKDIPDREFQSLLGRSVAIKELRQKIATLSLKPPLTYSPATALAWKILDQKLMVSVQTSRARLNNQKVGNREIPYSTSGPNYKKGSKAKLFQDIADVWVNSSKTMKSIVEGQGGTYIHFLQPNQYLLGSKPMGEDEKKVALVLEANPSFFNVNVPPGYAQLKQEVSKLEDNQVTFFDLTDAFAKTEQAVYVDSCCHLSAEGNEILAAVVLKKIKPVIEESLRNE